MVSVPYSKTSELPKSVQVLPVPAQRIYLSVFNTCHKSGTDEETCFRTAWAAVKKKYKYSDALGKWIKVL